MADDRTRDVEKKHALAVGMQRLERAAQPDSVVDIAFRLGWIGKGLRADDLLVIGHAKDHRAAALAAQRAAITHQLGGIELRCRALELQLPRLILGQVLPEPIDVSSHCVSPP